MRVHLKVTKGSSAGKQIEVKVPQFVIGRSSGCQLRPQSDAISRRHCVILMNEDGATVRDLGSRNGTVVNGEKIKGETRLQQGDELRIGPLHLQVHLSEVPAPKNAEKKAHASDTATPREPTKSDLKASDSGMISDWLLAEDDAADKSTGLSSVMTRQFQLDETERVKLEEAAEESADDAEAENEKDTKDKKKKKKEPGKLPTRKDDKTASSQEAAEQTLRKMFQRGL